MRSELPLATQAPQIAWSNSTPSQVDTSVIQGFDITGFADRLHKSAASLVALASTIIDLRSARDKAAFEQSLTTLAMEQRLQLADRLLAEYNAKLVPSMLKTTQAFVPKTPDFIEGSSRDGCSDMVGLSTSANTNTSSIATLNTPATSSQITEVKDQLQNEEAVMVETEITEAGRGDIVEKSSTDVAL